VANLSSVGLRPSTTFLEIVCFFFMLAEREDFSAALKVGRRKERA